MIDENQVTKWAGVGNDKSLGPSVTFAIRCEFVLPLKPEAGARLALAVELFDRRLDECGEH